MSERNTEKRPRNQQTAATDPGCQCNLLTTLFQEKCTSDLFSLWRRLRRRREEAARSLQNPGLLKKRCVCR